MPYNISTTSTQSYPGIIPMVVTADRQATRDPSVLSMRQASILFNEINRDHTDISFDPRGQSRPFVDPRTGVSGICAQSRVGSQVLGSGWWKKAVPGEGTYYGGFRQFVQKDLETQEDDIKTATFRIDADGNGTEAIGEDLDSDDPVLIRPIELVSVHPSLGPEFKTTPVTFTDDEVCWTPSLPPGSERSATPMIPFRVGTCTGLIHRSGQSGRYVDSKHPKTTIIFDKSERLANMRGGNGTQQFTEFERQGQDPYIYQLPKDTRSAKGDRAFNGFFSPDGVY